MTNFDRIWEEFSQMLTGSNLTEEQKCWLLLRLQSFIRKEIAAAQKVILDRNKKLSENKGITTKPDQKNKAEIKTARAYINAYTPMNNFLTEHCKEIIESLNELASTEKDKLTPTEQNDLIESLESSYQSDNSRARKKIRKISCGFNTCSKCKKDKE